MDGGKGAPKTNTCMGSSRPDLTFIFERRGILHGPRLLAFHPQDRACWEGKDWPYRQRCECRVSEGSLGSYGQCSLSSWKILGMPKTEFYCRGSETVHSTKNSMALEYISDHRGGVIKWKEHRIQNQETHASCRLIIRDLRVSVWASMSSWAEEGNK